MGPQVVLLISQENQVGYKYDSDGGIMNYTQQLASYGFDNYFLLFGLMPTLMPELMKCTAT